jgi:hypothetical protein
MDFLLECIGFPPDQDPAEIVELALAHGERAAWRGPKGDHWRLALGGGLELYVDREGRASAWSIHPCFASRHRLRLAIETARELPDSPCDALISGWGNPPVGADPSTSRDAYMLSALLNDARILPRDLRRGHVLAVALAGFALDVESARGSGGRPPPTRRFPDGGWIQPLGATEDPGGCVELDLGVRSVARLLNPLTKHAVAAIEADAPGRPLTLFTSPWQHDLDGVPRPAPGTRIRGTFLLSGRVAGGLPSAAERLGASFG